MKDKTERRPLEIVFRDGKLTAVILDIDLYRKMLERLEDLGGLEELEKMIKKALEFREYDIS